MLHHTRRAAWTTVLLLLCALLAQAQEIPVPDTSALPTRSVPESLPAGPVPDWLRTHFRVGHLPGSLPMSEAFVNAGYNVVTLNTLGRWNIVGPSASLYPAERVKEAEEVHAHRTSTAAIAQVQRPSFTLGPCRFLSETPSS